MRARRPCTTLHNGSKCGLWRCFNPAHALHIPCTTLHGQSNKLAQQLITMPRFRVDSEGYQPAPWMLARPRTAFNSHKKPRDFPVKNGLRSGFYQILAAKIQIPRVQLARQIRTVQINFIAKIQNSHKPPQILEKKWPLLKQVFILAYTARVTFAMKP